MLVELAELLEVEDPTGPLVGAVVPSVVVEDDPDATVVLPPVDVPVPVVTEPPPVDSVAPSPGAGQATQARSQVAVRACANTRDHVLRINDAMVFRMVFPV